MKLSFSRAAWIQWLALAVDWKGLVTWTQSHLTFPSSRSRIISVMWLPPLGLRGVGGVVHDHVARQAVGEGPDLARRAACRRLAGEGEGTAAGLRLLAREQVD